MSDPLPPTSAPSMPEPPQPTQPDGKAVAALVLGICSMFVWLCPIIGLIVAINGFVLGIISHRRQRTAMATAGIILSAIGGVASVINMIVGAYLGATGQHPWINAMQQG